MKIGSKLNESSLMMRDQIEKKSHRGGDIILKVK
jgi:hypothetical protein